MGNGIDTQHWEAYRDVYAFLGNELLTPINRSDQRCGLDPGFWGDAPVPDNEQGRHGLARLEAYARAAQEPHDDGDSKVPGLLQTAVEYTYLFIGPPRPTADPWETMNDPANERHVGYGRATVAMKKLLEEEGLELSNENHQYEDHIGIELLYLSALCDRASAASEAAREEYAGKARDFIGAHPLRWLPLLRAKVDEQRPQGYYSALLEYAEGVLADQAAALG